MKILITGGQGTLGKELISILGDHDVYAPESFYLDIRNFAQAMSFKELKPDIIIHLAAATDHIACEFNPADAYITNTIGTMNLIQFAKDLDIPIIYMSTGGVFDGKKEVYEEYDMPNPINHYSRSKFYGENAVKAYPKGYIIRTGWLMGGGLNDKKFVNKIFKLIKSGQEVIYAIEDIFGSPSYAPDVALKIKFLIENQHILNLLRIFHCVNEGRASRYDVACKIVEYLDLPISVVPVTYEEYHKVSPQNCNYTKCEALSSVNLNYLPFWQESLKTYIEKEFKPWL